MTNKIAAYKDLLKVVKKHSEAFDRENVTLSPEHLKSVVEAMEVSERFGIPLQGIQSGTHLRVKGVYDDWTGISLYGEKHQRTIGCSDNGKQPKDEWLFKISFPCGAYTFGGDGLWDKSYPKKTFDAFFEELKAYGTAFSDTMNNALYFREDNSKAVYEAFWGLFNKYKAMVADELKEQRKQELVKELEALEGN